jgi:hypothetical protein
MRSSCFQAYIKIKGKFVETSFKSSIYSFNYSFSYINRNYILILVFILTDIFNDSIHAFLNAFRRPKIQIQLNLIAPAIGNSQLADLDIGVARAVVTKC